MLKFSFFYKLKCIIISAPLIFISIISLLLSIILFYDWKTKKILFGHVTKPVVPRIIKENKLNLNFQHQRKMAKPANCHANMPLNRVLPSKPACKPVFAKNNLTIGTAKGANCHANMPLNRVLPHKPARQTGP